MATILLQAAGAALGGLVGGPIGAIFGRALGGVAGALVDQRLLGAGGAQTREGPRLTSLAGLVSTEGAAVPRAYGRARVGGQMIWATRFEEVATAQRQGGAGGKGAQQSKGSNVTYSYYANFAVGLCEGEIAEVRRVWADGKELDLTKFTLRFYNGDETQSAEDRKSTRLNSSHIPLSRMPSSA